MKLRYYIRGLGIGMAVTALILHFSGASAAPLSDAEIMRRAEELGMVKSVTLSELGQGTSDKEGDVQNDGKGTVSEGGIPGDASVSTGNIFVHRHKAAHGFTCTARKSISYKKYKDKLNNCTWNTFYKPAFCSFNTGKNQSNA